MRRGILLVAGVATASGLALGGSASETIVVNSVRPAVVRWAEAATITGGVGSGQANVDVYIDGQTCGDGRWDVISGAHTGPGGGFTAELGAGINLLVRARAEGATSNVVRVQQRPSVTLQQRPRGTFWVNVNAGRSFWKKHVLLQRYVPFARTWRNLRSAALSDSGSRPGSAFVWSATEKFRQQLPKGTLVRATLPLAQAKPCYAAGYSNMLRG
jgi:hypothetical protein